ncbi:carbohydrate ABC transporter substrate-binding protein, CUT1 family (TC 3.A.1.1.-) [Aquisalimonas asiatica]|uniref:Carbohydrate ABC transporter substrate-binding protein, CUT1 family (TC 3.A.1.1.-) n=2 Tax=Aquisalimonas asiatica TaxID=406100 RepID=A0A1H8UNN0_9GAMM|nr:carbohydrate ABC transporter substrate-binding protein, CUT1 family (TC 3.A.1.1.-) [Aquisalimonas asiatica]
MTSEERRETWRNYRGCVAAVATAVALAPAAAIASDDAETTVRLVRVETSDAEEAYDEEVVAAYEAENPDVNVEIEYIANEAYKTRLPTLLQSSQRPDIFYSWGGEGLRDQVDAGFVRDISDEMRDGWKDLYPEGAVRAFTLDDRIYGAPLYATVVGFWANTALTEEAGVDIEAVETWEEFEDAVVALREAGITPAVVGGQDGWPMHFYWGYLATRLAGGHGIEAAQEGADGGFAGPSFVRAAEMLQEFVELDPFQSGFMSSSYERASAMFGDQEAALHLMGDWDYIPHQERSETGEGVPDEDLEFLQFPAVTDGEGNEHTFGGINGFAVTRDAPDEAVDFLRFMLNEENQRKAARTGIFVPVAEGSEEDLETPYARRVAQLLDESEHHQVFLDQALGDSVGATVNDISGDLAQGVITPEEAADQIEEAWQFR